MVARNGGADGGVHGSPLSGPRAAPEFPAGRAAVAILVGTALFVLTQLYAAIPLQGPVTADLGGDATLALSTSFGIAYAVGFLIWGPLSDRYGRKRILVLATGLLAAATLLCAAATSLPMLAVLRAVQGASGAGFAPVALAYLSEAVAPVRRAAAIGAMSVAFLVAGIFGQVTASIVALGPGWPWFFFGGGLILALACVLIATVLRGTPRADESGSLARQFVRLGRLFTSPAIAALCAAHVTLLLSFVALYTGIGQHLQGSGVSESGVILIRLAALPAMFVSLAAGPLARLIGGPRVALLGFTVAATGMLGVALLAGSVPGMVAASIVFVAGIALTVPQMITLFGETAAPHRGSGMAINGFVLFIGASIGPLVAGAVPGLPALAAVLAGVLALAAIAITVFAAVRRRGRA
ncbi:MFS transporter [Leucobacter luti]|uniref:Putative MFS family arabinose efflux permease n=1 Tax=Leucobacter luti TaxID=340320 RepID=A0A4Q7TKJ7_9MICO|nr:MFS transporter [Leucobacter luti]MBL3700154.1 MFS transporter [Leucobacter luti]RZT61125.1 putative MFS family arabinose efflux permease [Leucobacter luti]